MFNDTCSTLTSSSVVLEEKDGNVSCTFRPYLCAVLYQDWKLIENARIGFFILYLLFQYIYEKTAYIDICKDAKAIHQLTLHDKSYTGFF